MPPRRRQSKTSSRPPEQLLADSKRSGSGSRAVAKGANSFRIIAGRWRGRRVSFPPNPELRPSPDRVRETLFNWLQQPIVGSWCLDPFAGSGALVLEALSRGALGVMALDRDAAAARSIKANGELLGLAGQQSLHTHSADSLKWLSGPAPRAFDVVFLDPPFERDWLPVLIDQLEQGGWLADNAWIYIEHERALSPLQFPPNWLHWREQQAGQVKGLLMRREKPE